MSVNLDGHFRGSLSQRLLASILHSDDLIRAVLVSILASLWALQLNYFDIRWYWCFDRVDVFSRLFWLERDDFRSFFLIGFVCFSLPLRYFFYRFIEVVICHLTYSDAIIWRLSLLNIAVFVFWITFVSMQLI